MANLTSSSKPMAIEASNAAAGWVEAKLSIVKPGSMQEGFPHYGSPYNQFQQSLTFHSATATIAGAEDQFERQGHFPPTSLLADAKHDWEHALSLTDGRGTLMEALNTGFWKAMAHYETLYGRNQNHSLDEQFKHVTSASLTRNGTVDSKNGELKHAAFTAVEDEASKQWTRFFENEAKAAGGKDPSLTFTGHIRDKFNTLRQVLADPERPANFEYGYCLLPAERDKMEEVTHRILKTVSDTPSHPPLAATDLFPAHGQPSRDLDAVFLSRFKS